MSDREHDGAEAPSGAPDMNAAEVNAEELDAAEVNAAETNAAEASKRPGKRKSKVLRPPGFAVFGGVVLLVAMAWYLFADRIVERSVEETGASIVGAKVDLDVAEIDPLAGRVRLGRLQVANPDAPMRNLFEADEIVGDLALAPLLEKKVVIEQLTVLGVRFDTERSTSGALENPDPEAGRLWREVNQWADGIEIPSLDFDDLGGTVRTEAISTDSLATVRYARDVRSRADSMRTAWESRLTALDPRPRIDSVAAVADRLQSFRLTPLNAPRLPGLLRDGRRALEEVTSLRTEITDLQGSVQSGMSSLAIGPDVVADLRARDLAYALSLLDIPSLEAPTISPALFGGTATTWLKPVLYWAQTAERFLPPGLDPRRRPGPKRARAEGTTYDFRDGAEYPRFLLQRGEIGVLLDGGGPADGRYSATLRNLTSAPSLVGAPLELMLGRAEGSQGPGEIALALVLDHTGPVLRDSLSLTMVGVELPDVDLGSLGGVLGLGVGRATFDVTRRGEMLDARMAWLSEQPRWLGEGSDTTSIASLELGSRRWAEALVRRTIAGVDAVDVEMSLSGTISTPSISVRSNLGDALSASLQRELGREIDAAEARVRAELEERIAPVVTEARARVDGIASDVVSRVDARREEVEALRARLEERIEQLVGGNVVLGPTSRGSLY